MPNIELLLLQKAIQERQAATRFIILMGGLALTALTVVILFVQLGQMFNALSKDMLHKPAPIVIQAQERNLTQIPNILSINEMRVDNLTMPELPSSVKVPILNRVPLKKTPQKKVSLKKALRKLPNERCPKGYRLFEPGLCLNIITNDFRHP